MVIITSGYKLLAVGELFLRVRKEAGYEPMCLGIPNNVYCACMKMDGGSSPVNPFPELLLQGSPSQ